MIKVLVLLLAAGASEVQSMYSKKAAAAVVLSGVALKYVPLISVLH